MSPYRHCRHSKHTVARRASFCALVAIGLASALLATAIGCSATSTGETGANTASADSSTTGSGIDTVISADMAGMDFDFSNRDTATDYDSASATTIALNDAGTTIAGAGATASGDTVTIASEGTYIVSGSLSNGQILVTADETAKVHIVFAGVSITGGNGPCVYIQSCDKAFITLADGTQNTLSDGTAWTLSGTDGEPNATIYSKSDLTFNGNGSLMVQATVKHAIVSKDDLAITGGSYTIEAAGDGIRGKDCVKINGGTFAISAVQDGIKTTNDSDDNRGFVFITGGTFTINAQDDGIHATRLIRISEGSLTIAAGDDAMHSNTDLLIDGGSVSIDAKDDAVHGEYNLCISSGTLHVASCYEGIEGQGILISGGDIYVASDDDGINASEGGTSSTKNSAAGSGDQSNPPTAQGTDTMPAAPGTQQNDSATSQAPQGTPTAPDSQQTEHAMSDGQQNGTSGGQQSSSDEVGTVTISGGQIVLVCTKDGDSIDSNGSLTMTGGLVLISGTTQNDNGALDYDTTATITGGTILALGSTGMAQSFGSDSTQASIVATVQGNAGDLVSITDSSNAVLCSFKAVNEFSWILASNSAIQNGSSYHILIGGSNAAANEYGYASSGTVSGTAASTDATATTAQSSQSMGAGPTGMQGGGMGGPQNGSGAQGSIPDSNRMQAPQSSMSA